MQRANWLMLWGRWLALIQCLQPGADFAGRAVGLHQQSADGEETVELARKMSIGHGNAGLSQPLGVFVAFIAQGIGPRGQHIGRRQPREYFRARRRGLPVVDIAAAVEIVVAKPFYYRMRQKDAGFRLAMRGMRHRKIGGRIDQNLSGDPRTTAVARRYRSHSAKIPPNPFPATHHPPPIASAPS